MKRVDYGILFMERLKKSGAEFIDARTVAADYGLSSAFLEKVAQELKAAGLVEGRKGRGGGYRMTAAGAGANVGDLINFFERPYEACPVLRAGRKKSGITP